jgi:hypothetical protein
MPQTNGQDYGLGKFTLILAVIVVLLIVMVATIKWLATHGFLAL